MTALEKAISIANGVTALAKLLGVEPNVVSNWKARGVPTDVCPDIEAVTGVLCEELKPSVNWGVLRKPVKKSTKEAI